MTSPVDIKRPAVEVADVIREFGEAFLATYGGSLSGIQRKALIDLVACRTATLGGHVQRCHDCGQRETSCLQLLPQSSLSQMPGPVSCPVAGA